MSVDIEPFELSFRRPFTVEVSRTLTLKNPNSTPVAFKVKTTAPKQYCVRPNAGRIEPGQSFDVSVLLQAMKADPAPDAKCRDKFLVQSAPITPDKEFASIASVLDGTEKGILQERKIRVVWLLADADDHTGSAGHPATATPSKSINGTTDTPEAARTYSSPTSHADATPSSAPPPYDDDSRGPEDDVKSDGADTTLSHAASTVTATAQMTYEELKDKLVKAEAQIASLKDSSGLRQRNVKAGADGSKGKQGSSLAQATKQGAEGVPVQIVALLCLVSFLLAYFFF